MALKFINEDTGDIKTTVFCFTGKSPKTRPEMEAIAIKAGAQVTSSVNGRTTILVIADANSMSSKAQSARDRNICLISPEQFFDMCSYPGYTRCKTIVYDAKTRQQLTKSPNKKKKHSLVRRIQL